MTFLRSFILDQRGVEVDAQSEVWRSAEDVGVRWQVHRPDLRWVIAADNKRADRFEEARLGRCYSFWFQTSVSFFRFRVLRDGYPQREILISPEDEQYISTGEQDRVESVLFFPKVDGNGVPDVLLSDGEVELKQYREACERGSIYGILEILDIGTTEPFRRVCRSFGLNPDASDGRLEGPQNGLLRRLFGRWK